PVLGAQSLIKIDPNAGHVARPDVNVDPFAFYLSYYRSRDESRINPDKLRQTLAGLNRLRKYREVHAAILGYLKNLAYNRVPPEPWMYEALGLALKMNGGSEEDRKKAFNYAADLAQKSHNPNHLTSVADRLFIEGYLDRVGPMLDEAMPKVPHRIDPIIMSIN